ncbi:MAG: flagellar protein FlaG [Syntrophales bacterium]|jgi:flagellar protein FlaG|nr:flagellar protein FlaG [Syntrophales bacterium]
MNVNAVETGGGIANASVVAAPPVPSGVDTSSRNKAEEEVAPSKSQIREMVAEMQGQIDSMNVSLSFSTYGEKGEHMAVVVADKETGEVIREIPSKEIQRLYAKMSEIAGFIFDRQI